MSQLCCHFRVFALALPIFWNALPPDICTVCSYTLLRLNVSPQSYSLKYSNIPMSLYSLSPSAALFLSWLLYPPDAVEVSHFSRKY